MIYILNICRGDPAWSPSIFTRFKAGKTYSSAKIKIIFSIAVRERQTEPGFGQLNQNILYFCAVIPHNLRHSFVCCGTSETPSPTGLWHITLIFREPCFCYLHGSAVMFVKLARGRSSGTLAAATSSFIPRVSIVPVTSIMSFFLVMKQNAL